MIIDRILRCCGCPGVMRAYRAYEEEVIERDKQPLQNFVSRLFGRKVEVVKTLSTIGWHSTVGAIDGMIVGGLLGTMAATGICKWAHDGYDSDGRVVGCLVVGGFVLYNLTAYSTGIGCLAGTLYGIWKAIKQ